MNRVAISEPWSIRNDESGREVPLPTIEGASPDRTVSFVNKLSYLPDLDNDFSFRIRTIDPARLDSAAGAMSEAGRFEFRDSYRVDTWRGRSTSRISFELKTFELPGFVHIWRDYLILEGNRDHATTRVDIAPGHEAIAILELLEYDADGDNDLLYAVRAFAVGSTIVAAGLSDFGNARSRVVVRVTILSWPTGSGVSVTPGRMRATHREGSDEWAFLGNDQRWLASPTMYLTDTSKYPYGAFESTDYFYEGLSAASVAGRDLSALLSFFGKVTGPATAAGTAIAEGEKKKIVENVGKLFGALIEGSASLRDLRSDRRDNDFFLRITSAGTERTSPLPDTRVRIDTGNGNRFALGEVTIWSLALPGELTPAIVSALTSQALVSRLRGVVFGRSNES